MKKNCSNCGYVNPVTGLVCNECGSRLPFSRIATPLMVPEEKEETGEEPTESLPAPGLVPEFQPGVKMVEQLLAPLFSKIDGLVSFLHATGQQQDKHIMTLQERVRVLEEALTSTALSTPTPSPDIHFHFPEQVTFKKTELPRVKVIERDEQGLITHVVEKDAEA